MWLCGRCGLRQADGPACAACRSTALHTLEEEESRAHALDALQRKVIADHEDALIRKAKTVRHAPFYFVFGGALMMLPLGAVGMMYGPYGGVVAAAILLGGSYGLGAVLRSVAPRWLLGKDERRQIKWEIDGVARRDLPMEVLHPPAPAPGVTRLRGQVAGTPSVGPFSDEPLLAARLVGHAHGFVVDDAWFAPGPITLTEASEARAELASVISLAWIAAEARESLDLSRCSRDLGDRLRDYLTARGVTSLDEARRELRALAPGDHVVVSGRPRTRAVSDGYRAQVEVVDLESATVERVTPREASPTTAATADTDEAS